MAIKIDIKKAFDTMEWDFIFAVLLSFGFSQKFCDWIWSIFDSARLLVIINGGSHGYFSVSQGVRQGNPLSSLLFCLAEDFLSRKLSNLTYSGLFIPMYGGRHFNCPSHFTYADDVLIFGKASRSHIDVLARVFSE